MSEIQYTAAEIMAAISAAIRDDNLTAAVSLIRLLAVVSPSDAAFLYDGIQLLAATTEEHS